MAQILLLAFCAFLYLPPEADALECAFYKLMQGVKPLPCKGTKCAASKEYTMNGELKEVVLFCAKALLECGTRKNISHGGKVTGYMEILCCEDRDFCNAGL
ncbi:Hypothetical predicted protein [Podarcis lilfordi]|uniref:UPAR/Ly6 domain-containing protein n=1 Tax=Podarcis lilfordi TaxID=74358 RepID=A0AA35K5F1_9SAUR|nr:Hypothetical predicted protein [Podarcis lilfordi]